MVRTEVRKFFQGTRINPEEGGTFETINTFCPTTWHHFSVDWRLIFRHHHENLKLHNITRNSKNAIGSDTSKWLENVLYPSNLRVM
jgi:hypothetical protein